MIGCGRVGANKKTDETDCMTMEPTKPYGRQMRHIEELKKQISHCLDKELTMLAEERSERAERIGLRDLIERQPRDH